MSTLRPGVRFGPYEVLSALGAGATGEVYRARDTRLDRTAIKIFSSEIAAAPDLRERFEREGMAIGPFLNESVPAAPDTFPSCAVEE